MGGAKRQYAREYRFVDVNWYAGGSIKNYTLRGGHGDETMTSVQIKQLWTQGVSFVGLELKDGKLYIANRYFEK
jgi:hypothetical protein